MSSSPRQLNRSTVAHQLQLTPAVFVQHLTFMHSSIPQAQVKALVCPVAVTSSSAPSPPWPACAPSRQVVAPCCRAHLMPGCCCPHCGGEGGWGQAWGHVLGQGCRVLLQGLQELCPALGGHDGQVCCCYPCGCGTGWCLLKANLYIVQKQGLHM
jgi:hypothetical protein